jgi:hypothetical protein
MRAMNVNPRLRFRRYRFIAQFMMYSGFRTTKISSELMELMRDDLKKLLASKLDEMPNLLGQAISEAATDALQDQIKYLEQTEELEDLWELWEECGVTADARSGWDTNYYVQFELDKTNLDEFLERHFLPATPVINNKVATPPPAPPSPPPATPPRPRVPCPTCGKFFANVNLHRTLTRCTS